MTKTGLSISNYPSVLNDVSEIHKGPWGDCHKNV